MNIHCLNSISEIGLEKLTEDYKIVSNIDEADAILVRSANMKDMPLPTKVIAVARAGAGVNNIPLDDYADRGIVVFNTPGANANGVKELVLCGLLLASRDILAGSKWVDSISNHKTIEKDIEKGKKAFVGREIKGKKLGVIGLGAIGAEVANAAIALGMKVYGYDPYLSVNAAWRLSSSIRHVTDINEIYEKCDYITLHVPMTDDNKGMIGDKTIPLMKDGVVILNLARGGLVDDISISRALASGKVSRYVTDFPDEMTASMEGCIAIPHLGASTVESEENCAEMAVEELMDYLENGNIKNSVNYPTCDMGPVRSSQRITLLHQNIPNMIGQITSVIAGSGLNIENMTNKSRDKYAYTMIDIESKATADNISALKNIEGVLKVRII